MPQPSSYIISLLVGWSCQISKKCREVSIPVPSPLALLSTNPYLTSSAHWLGFPSPSLGLLYNPAVSQSVALPWVRLHLPSLASLSSSPLTDKFSVNPSRCLTHLSLRSIIKPFSWMRSHLLDPHLNRLCFVVLAVLKLCGPGSASLLLGLSHYIWPQHLHFNGLETETKESSITAESALKFVISQDSMPTLFLSSELETWKHSSNYCMIHAKGNNAKITKCSLKLQGSGTFQHLKLLKPLPPSCLPIFEAQGLLSSPDSKDINYKLLDTLLRRANNVRQEFCYFEVAVSLFPKD